MAEQKIGIKVADGTFYPILDESERKQKRLVLTTVNDDQENVQIDLYKGSEGDIADAAYVGSLVVENIGKTKGGEAEIEMIVGIDDEGNLQTTAEDKSAGAKQSLSVRLQNLDEEGLYEVPDFSLEEEAFSGDEIEDVDWDAEDAGEEFDTGELDTEDFATELEASDTEVPAGEAPEVGEETPEALDFDDELPDFGEESGSIPTEPGELDLGEDFDLEEDFAQEEGFEDLSTAHEESFDQEPQFEEEHEEEEEERESKSRPLLVGILVILALALIGALLYLFVFMAETEEPVPPLEAQNAPIEEGEQGSETADSTEAEEALETADTGEEETTIAEVETESPSASAQPGEGEALAPGSGNGKENWEDGVWYRVRWGDTLWGISSSFYNSPWFYNELADQNDIHNPDRIYAEEEIFIPKPD